MKSPRFEESPNSPRAACLAVIVEVNAEIRYHDVEVIGEELRAAMGNMKSL